MKPPRGDGDGWGCFLAAASVGVVLMWIWQGITYPFRIIRRLF